MRAILAVLLLAGCTSGDHSPIIDWNDAEIFGRSDCRELTAAKDGNDVVIGSRRSCAPRDGGKRRS